MSVTTDIFRSWFRPRAVMERRLEQEPDEKIAFVYLAVFSVLGFVAALPGLIRQSREVDPETQRRMMEEAAERGLAIPADPTAATFESLFSGALMGWIFIVPLFLYGVAFLSHLLAKALGGRGTGLRARVALFWSALAITPVMLLLGLTTGFVGAGPAQLLVATILLCGFIWIWLNSLYIAETPA
ncbi:YIP1 family protein [Jannaschia donghaensis]|uniref:Yip1 domain protein n=1 Tax=Jannaschia donghaensis TaxID=420998 RepID=A0A0M6YLS0_9RHOB|nr:YIP1 family protein [Jannaschia donghaensis]CTQ50463.1 Yip1 domain protein [Jannaschia donghaensis]